MSRPLCMNKCIETANGTLTARADKISVFFRLSFRPDAIGASRTYAFRDELRFGGRLHVAIQDVEKDVCERTNERERGSR